MCVIIVAKNKTPRPALLIASERINPHGAGIAWKDPDTNLIRVEKGLDWKDILKISEKAPFPQLMHFRAATSGGRDFLLNHPFPISEDVELEYSGEYESVLAHNGHCGRSETYVEKRQPLRWKNELWSDSRAMAYAVYKEGKKWLNGSYQRVAIFDKEGITLHGGWDLNLTNFALSCNIISWFQGKDMLDKEDMEEYDERHFQKHLWNETDACAIKAAQGHMPE